MNDDHLSDLDEEVDQATISFVPQVGDQQKKKKKQRGPQNRNGMEREMMSPNGANPSYPPMPNGQQQPQGYQPPPQLGYGIPDFATPTSIQQPNVAYSQQQMMQPQKPLHDYGGGGGSPQIVTGQSVYNAMQPGFDNVGNNYNNNNGYPGAAAASSPYQSYPTASQYAVGGGPGNNMMAPGQPGAMILLVQQSQDLDFRAPLCGGTCMQCLNAFFLPYCLLARQANMLKSAAISYRTPNANGELGAQDQHKVQDAAAKTASISGCCAAAMLFDFVRAAGAIWFPQIAGTFYVVNGLCIQTLNTRQMLRSRFGIRTNTCQDIGVSWCCSCCAIAQQQNEMIIRLVDPNLICGQPANNNTRPRNMM